MKKIILSFALSLVFAANVMAQSLPTAQQVIDNYITALGGKQKLEAVKTLSMKNNISVMGMDMEGKTIKKDNKFKSTQSMMGQEMVQLFDGEKGYAMQMGQKIDFPAEQVEKMKKMKVIDALSMDASKIKSVTSEDADGKKCYVLTGDDNKSYFDSATGLLYKTTGEQNVTINKYADFEGVKLPEEMTIGMSGMDAVVKNSEFQINKGVTDEDFK